MQMVQGLKSSYSANLEETLILCKGWDQVNVGSALKRYGEQVIQVMVQSGLEEDLSIDWVSQKRS